MATRVVKLITLILIMLVTGVFWGTWFTLTRSIDEFTAAEFIHIGKVIIANVANPMKFIMPSCIIFLVVCNILYFRRNRNVFYYMAVSLVLMVITLMITLLVEVPIDNDIKAWTVTIVPANWEAIRSKWAFYHEMRTFTALAAFVFFGTGLLLGMSTHRAKMF